MQIAKDLQPHIILFIFIFCVDWVDYNKSGT